METIAFALVAIAFVTAGFFVWYFTFKAKQEERRFLIEKGYKLEDLPASNSFNIQFPWVKLGIVMVAAVLGMLLNEVIFSIYKGTVPAMILGAGIGMILANAFENGYPVRTFWRTFLFAVIGFGIAGMILSILHVMVRHIDDGIAISTFLLSVSLALFIERRTRKSDEPGA
jgi:hypothetical protein